MKLKFIASAVLTLCAMNVGAMDLLKLKHNEISKKLQFSYKTIVVSSNEENNENIAFRSTFSPSFGGSALKMELKAVLRRHKVKYSLTGDTSKKKKTDPEKFYLYTAKPNSNYTGYIVKYIGMVDRNKDVFVAGLLRITWENNKKKETYGWPLKPLSKLQ